MSTNAVQDRSETSSSPDSEFEFDPPPPKALEEQLGLRLERGKVPVEYLVVDHIEKATENNSGTFTKFVQVS